MPQLDATDARILLELSADPRLSGVEIAQRLDLSRNTVQSHLAKLDSAAHLGAVDRRVTNRSLGYPLTAFVSAHVDQHHLVEIESAMQRIPEVVEMHGVSGGADILIRVVARDTDDLYRLAGLILASPYVQRTEVALSMREMIGYRMAPLLERRSSGA